MHSQRGEATELNSPDPRRADEVIATGRRTAPDPGVTARGEDDSVGVDDVPGTVLQFEAVRTESNIVADEEFCNVERIEDRNLQLHGAVNQRSLDLEPRVVTGECGSAMPALPATEAASRALER
jgi:hypothetical protein